RFNIQLEDFDLVELVGEVVERFEEEARRAGSAVTIAAPASARGRWDRTRLDQALTNLLANAIKYGAGKPVEVAVAVDAAIARVTVHDEGIGIASEDLHRIFDRFERAVSSTHYGGLGLGLYIARQIVEAHGGQIQVKSNPGAGATF